MGSFANALFGVLLGWLQGAAAWLWRLATDADAQAWLAWIRHNWLPLTLLLCLVGILIDLLIYIIRWQPYRVWRGVLQEAQEPDEEDEEDDLDPNAPVRHRWIFADGTSMPAPEDVIRPERAEAAARAAEREQQLDSPIRPVKRVMPAKRRHRSDGSDEYILPEISDGRDTYHRPCYPPQWTGSTPPVSDGNDQGGQS